VVIHAAGQTYHNVLTTPAKCSSTSFSSLVFTVWQLRGERKLHTYSYTHREGGREGNTYDPLLCIPQDMCTTGQVSDTVDVQCHHTVAKQSHKLLSLMRKEQLLIRSYSNTK
jgi:hypothetical protein